MGSARADGGADVVAQPADEVVADVFGVLVHVRAGGGVLLADLDGVEDAALLGERAVPVLDALADKAAVAHGHGVLDVEDDGLLGRAERERGVALLDVPAVGVADDGLVVGELAEVAVCRCEVADALVGLAGLEVLAALDAADGVVELLQDAAGGGHLDGDLDVVGEGLGLDDLGEPGVGAACGSAEEVGGLAREEVVEGDDGLAAGAHANDRYIKEHAVGKDVLDRVLRFLVAGGAGRDLRGHKREPLVVALPVGVEVAALEAGEQLARADGHGEEVLLPLVAARELGEHLAVLLSDPDGVEARSVFCRR